MQKSKTSLDDISKELIGKASMGDKDAFRELYDLSSKYVYNLCLKYLRNDKEADEVTQEVFITIFKKLHTFRFESSFKTWIYRVTINTAIQYGRKKGKHKARSAEYRDELDYRVSEPQANQKIDADHYRGVIQKLLSHLNPDQRACIILRNMEEMTYEEIAETLNIKINTVRSRIKRARAKLLKLKNEVMGYEM